MWPTNGSLLYKKDIVIYSDTRLSVGFDAANIVHIRYNVDATSYVQGISIDFLFGLFELNEFTEILSDIQNNKVNTTETLWINGGAECLRVNLYVNPSTNFSQLLELVKGENQRALLTMGAVQSLVVEICSVQEIISKRPQLKQSDSLKNEREVILHSKTKNRSSINSPRAFIVHGHSHGTKETVARFVEQLGIESVILHEQVNKGRTIVEKFIDFSDVNYAIILLTADDKGGSKDASIEKQKLRARQNVILELGFFLGKLGRENVCALYEDEVEIPSDYSGVLFISLDNQEAWKIKLAKELKAAGLKVDISKII